MKRIIEISEETYQKIEHLLNKDERNETYDSFIGKKLFIRTVTYHCIGKVEAIVGKFFMLSGGSWIADSGRFMNAIQEGTLDEVEPVGNMWVSIDAIVDMFPWIHDLPIEQK